MQFRHSGSIFIESERILSSRIQEWSDYHLGHFSSTYACYVWMYLHVVVTHVVFTVNSILILVWQSLAKVHMFVCEFIPFNINHTLYQ